MGLSYASPVRCVPWFREGKLIVQDETIGGGYDGWYRLGVEIDMGGDARAV